MVTTRLSFRDDMKSPCSTRYFGSATSGEEYHSHFPCTFSGVIADMLIAPVLATGTHDSTGALFIRIKNHFRHHLRFIQSFKRSPSCL